ncbi:MAG: hypothetical protein ACM3JG_20605 [Thiohalocapsa sp.]
MADLGRLLSPNEAKFWLLDSVAPMNSIVVIECAEDRPPPALPREFRLPVVRLGKQGRPRWWESDAPGVLAYEEVAGDMAWLDAAERLQQVRVGQEGQPPWHAVVQRHDAAMTLVLAVNHALSDWRSALHIASCLLADKDPGALLPACEEMLPATLFADPEAEALIDAWWSSRAGARWEALGLSALTAHLPPPAATRFAVQRLDAATTERLRERLASEGVSLNNALAVALRDVMMGREVMQLDAVAHAVDMQRFIRPPPAPGPGLAVAHVFTPLGDGEFWEAARDNRGALFEAVRGGAAGDALLALPRALLGGDAPRYEAAAMTITGAPTVGGREGEDIAYPMQLVLSSARGGGGILILSHHRDCLQLVAGTPDGQRAVPLPAIIARLIEAIA